MQPIANRFCSALQIDAWKAQLVRKLITLQHSEALGGGTTLPLLGLLNTPSPYSDVLPMLSPRDSPTLTTESSLQSTPPRLTPWYKRLVNEVEVCLCESKLLEELKTTNKDESLKTVNLWRITTITTMILPSEILASLLHLCAAENTCWLCQIFTMMRLLLGSTNSTFCELILLHANRAIFLLDLMSFLLLITHSY